MALKLKKEHDKGNLSQLSQAFGKFVDEEFKEKEHDPKTLNRLKVAFKKFVSEEGIEKISPTSSQVHIPAMGDEDKIVVKSANGTIVEIHKGGDGSGPHGGGDSKTTEQHEAATKATGDALNKSEATLGRAITAHDENPTPSNKAKEEKARSNNLAAHSAHQTQLKAHIEHLKSKMVGKDFISKGGPGSGVGEDNTLPINMPHSPYTSVGTRKGMLQNMDYSEESVPMDSITHAGQEKYVPKKLEKIMQSWDNVKDKPIELLHVGDEYHIIDGHHRYLAAKKLGEKHINANVRVKAQKTMGNPLPQTAQNKPSDIDESAEIYPGLDNLEVELLKAYDEEMSKLKKQTYEDDGGERFEDDDSNDSNNLDGLYGYQLLVEGMDWELEHTTADPDDARAAAEEQLEIDPMHYRKLTHQADSTDDVLAKDLNENDQNPWEPKGLSIDLGSGQTREPGYIGMDLYPYDHGTMVHDLDLGIPLPDESVENCRMCNYGSDDLKPMLSEIHRVMMPGGQFTYEGPNDIYNYPNWEQDYPGLILTDHESNSGEVDDGVVHKEGPGSNIFRQTFTRLAIPDPATANDAEPRIGVAAYDELPNDVLIAADAMSYYNADATSSGRGNRLHGYASQGALFDDDHSNAGGSDVSAQPALKAIRFVKDQNGAEDDSATNANPMTPEEQQVQLALNPVNPNPAPPKKLSRGVSKIQKALKSERIVPIMKMNTQKQIVYGVVLAPNEIDAQDDFMEPHEIEKAAHRYLANSRVVGSGHSKPVKAHPVESFIAPQDFEIHGQYGNQMVKAGSWVLGVKIDDPDEWQKVMEGHYQGFSVGGVGARQQM